MHDVEQPRADDVLGLFVPEVRGEGSVHEDEAPVVKHEDRVGEVLDERPHARLAALHLARREIALAIPSAIEITMCPTRVAKSCLLGRPRARAPLLSWQTTPTIDPRSHTGASRSDVTPFGSRYAVFSFVPSAAASASSTAYTRICSSVSK